jgi:manganese oxidase
MTQTTPPAAATEKPRSRTMLYGIIVIILIVVGVGVYYLTVGSQSNANNGTPVSIFDGTGGACTQTASPPNCGFSPQTLNVKTGTNNTITWTNNGQQAHTASANVTANGSLPSFDSGSKNRGDKFTFTLNTAGAYHYYCKFHPWMTGTIVVST